MSRTLYTFLAALLGLALAAGAGVASAGQPVALTSAQLDNITAGSGDDGHGWRGGMDGGKWCKKDYDDDGDADGKHHKRHKKHKKHGKHHGKHHKKHAKHHRKHHGKHHRVRYKVDS